MKSVKTISSDSQLSPGILRVIIEGCIYPLVIKGQLDPWVKSRSWKAREVCDALKSTYSTFKVFPRRGTAKHKAFFESKRRVAFETDCLHVEGTFEDFREWLEYSQVTSPRETTPPNHEVVTVDKTAHPPAKKPARAVESPPDTTVQLGLIKACSNALLAYPATEFWVYADYNYMCKICKDAPELLSAVDWGCLGFEGRSGKDSALWVGSEGAYTPCHYDTYGYNLVAQLAGEKTWTLFGPEDSACMYPSRIPFEESSVFSEVNVIQPDIEKHPLHKNATPFQVHIIMLTVFFAGTLSVGNLSVVDNTYITQKIEWQRCVCICVCACVYVCRCYWRKEMCWWCLNIGGTMWSALADNLLSASTHGCNWYML